MPDDILITILTITWAAIGFGFVLDLRNSNKISVMHSQFNTLVALLGEKIARVLHSPHTPELDVLLEKLERHENLSDAEKLRLLRMTHEIIHNIGGERTKEERTMAAILFALLAVREDYHRPAIEQTTTKKEP
ncbi:MAG: hypothetical protein KGL39_35385 [Patescibacteria group bacterium]|nr:hypothetical protein [Patescibacteria group bacterium]